MIHLIIERPIDATRSEDVFVGLLHVDEPLCAMDLQQDGIRLSSCTITAVTLDQRAAQIAMALNFHSAVDDEAIVERIACLTAIKQGFPDEVAILTSSLEDLLPHRLSALQRLPHLIAAL